MDCSIPGFPVHHKLPVFTQTHVHWVRDAIQPSHVQLSPSPPALNLTQHWGIFKWVSSSRQVVKVLELQLQCQSFQWIFRTDFQNHPIMVGWWGADSPLCQDECVFSLVPTSFWRGEPSDVLSMSFELHDKKLPCLIKNFYWKHVGVKASRGSANTDIPEVRPHGQCSSCFVAGRT